MKQIIFFFCTIGLFINCTKTNQTAEKTTMDNIDTVGQKIKLKGVFASAPGESISGNCLVLQKDNMYSIALENFSAGNGPDLHLYISTDLKATEFIDLGKLKSTNGDQVYALSAVPDFEKYAYILIYCQQYGVLFGSAELK